MTEARERKPGFDLLEEFPFLANVKICFCTLCSQSPGYGHCYMCPCGNHVAAPAVPDAFDFAKMRDTVEHLKDLLKHAVAARKETPDAGR